MVGEVIGNFRITAQLGRGGMGDVYRAEQISVGSLVAIKLLTAELSADQEYVQRLFNEARAVGRIRHPGVVQVFDVGVSASGRAYLIMELLDGETLRRALIRGRMDAGRIADLGKQLASVLEATHAAGITHRDLKPDNIFLVPDPQLPGGTRVKVLDFGIAKLTGTLQGHSPTTVGTMGTPAYMAPEQWGDPTRIDQRADLYALGCLMFEAAVGRPPFLVTTMAEACGKHLNEAPPRARTIAGDVPVALDALLDRLLAKSPEARGTARDVSLALDALLVGTANTVDPQRTQATALPPPSSPAAGPPPRSRVPWVIGLLVLVLVAGGVIVALVSDPSPTHPAKADTAPAALPAPIATTQAPADTGTPGSGALTSASADFLSWLERENPWLTDGGVPAQYFAVRRHEYLRYLATLADQPRAWAKPLFRAAIDGDTATLNWITYEQAEAYCKAIGAKLPTSAQWERMDAVRTGVNAGGLRIWTSTKNDRGQAMLRGTFTELQPSEIEKERLGGFTRWMDTEASAGGRDPMEKVASREVGVRCVR